MQASKIIRRLLALLLLGSLCIVPVLAENEEETVQDNETAVYTYLTEEMGLSTAAACGVMANIEYESEFDPTVWGDGGASHGLCQWYSSRCEALSRFCEENGYDEDSVLGQMAYLQYELEESYSGVSRVKTYLADDADGRAILAAIRVRYPSLGVSYVEDSDWENNWREYYKPIEVGERLVVVPEWEETPQNGRIPLRLDPGLIFGTGSHPTTRMCLAALEGCAGPGKRVLDLGCGSGILGIGALLLGCGICVGCDIDPKAPDVAAANAALNGIGPDRFSVYAGDILSDASLRRLLGGGYDLVLANIVAGNDLMENVSREQFPLPDPSESAG